MTDHPRTQAAADARHAELGGDESVIPKGDHCYTPKGMIPGKDGELPRLEINLCPYWALRERGDGYCAKLGCGDADEDGTMLLFDQVKECEANRYSEAEEAEAYGLTELGLAPEKSGA